MASALFGSTAIGYGDLFDRKVDDNTFYRTPTVSYNNHYRTPPVSYNNQYIKSIYNAYDIKSNITYVIIINIPLAISNGCDVTNIILFCLY